MAQLFTADRFTPIDGNGHVYAGALLYFYQTGTTTLQTVYSDSGATVALSNPVVADANGLFPAIYLSNVNAYKVVLQTSAAVLLRTTDPVSAAGGSSATFKPQGRLTLASGTPVMTANQTAATTIYYTPYAGNQIPIYDGTSAFVATTFAELTNLTTQSVTGSAGPAAVTLNSNYDLFVWNNAGVATLTRGPAWSSDTARGTGAGTTQLQAVNGVQTNAVAITNGPAANRGTYVGTVRSDGSSQINWIQGGVAAGGTAAVLGVWNMYNRISVAGMVGDSTANWTYSAAAFRSANNSTGWRVSWISGLQEEPMVAKNNQRIGGGGSSTGAIAIGLNSISAAAGQGAHGSLSSGQVINWEAQAETTVLGWNFYQALEGADGSTVTTWYGNAGFTYQTSGLHYRGRA